MLGNYNYNCPICDDNIKCQFEKSNNMSDYIIYFSSCNKCKDANQINVTHFLFLNRRNTNLTRIIGTSFYLNDHVVYFSFDCSKFCLLDDNNLLLGNKILSYEFNKDEIITTAINLLNNIILL